MTPLHTYRGLSGQSYAFILYPLHQQLPPVTGVYMFVQHSAFYSDQVLYVGKTVDFTSRPGLGMQNHENAMPAKQRGANHIGIHYCGFESERRMIEEDLIKGLNPPLNVQHRNALGGLLGAYGKKS